MGEHNYFKAHLTFEDGTTSSCTDQSLLDVICHARHMAIEAKVSDGVKLKKLRLSTMFNDGDELGPYEISFVEDW
jgi:hypothetical protein